MSRVDTVITPPRRGRALSPASIDDNRRLVLYVDSDPRSQPSHGTGKYRHQPLAVEDYDAEHVRPIRQNTRVEVAIESDLRTRLHVGQRRALLSPHTPIRQIRPRLIVYNQEHAGDRH